MRDSSLRSAAPRAVPRTFRYGLAALHAVPDGAGRWRGRSICGRSRGRHHGLGNRRACAQPYRCTRVGRGPLQSRRRLKLRVASDISCHSHSNPLVNDCLQCPRSRFPGLTAKMPNEPEFGALVLDLTQSRAKHLSAYELLVLNCLRFNCIYLKFWKATVPCSSLRIREKDTNRRNRQ